MPYSSCWSDVLRSHYYTDLVLFHDYRTGTLLDQGPNGLNGTAVLPLEWQVPTIGKNVSPANGRQPGTASGYVSVADNVALRLATTGTLIAFVAAMPITGTRCLIAKADGALWNYILVATATQLIFQDNGGGRALNFVLPRDTRMIGCTFSNGVAPNFYVNGDFAGAAAANCVITTGVGPTLQIGNLYNTVDGFDTMAVVLIFSSMLTGAENSQLYNDFMGSGHCI